MSKKLAVMLMILVGWAVSAQADLIQHPIFNVTQLEGLFQSEVSPQALPWQVGDTGNYTMNIGGFLNGTMVMKVREEVFEGFWVDQDMDLGFAGKQKAEMLVDKNSGKILQLIVNGEKQEVPAGDNQEVEEMRDDKITVPAGSFDCVYVRIKDTKTSEVSEIWVNPTLVPITGMLKTLANSQLGKVTIELTSFEKR